jgi:hypothetical protein
MSELEVCADEPREDTAQGTQKGMRLVQHLGQPAGSALSFFLFFFLGQPGVHGVHSVDVEVL